MINELDDLSTSKSLLDNDITDFLHDMNTLYRNILSAYNSKCQSLAQQQKPNQLNLLHEWLLHNDKISNVPTPVKNQRKESAFQLQTNDQTIELRNDMGINYCKVVGELVFLMVACHPDISSPLEQSVNTAPILMLNIMTQSNTSFDIY